MYISILQNSILLDYCSILQNNHYAWTYREYRKLQNKLFFKEVKVYG